jgi:hypothetical protein
MTMDNVQNYNSYTNFPSSQTQGSYLSYRSTNPHSRLCYKSHELQINCRQGLKNHREVRGYNLVKRLEGL